MKIRHFSRATLFGLLILLTALSNIAFAQESSAPPSKPAYLVTQENQTPTSNPIAEPSQPKGAAYIKKSGSIGIGVSLSNSSYFLGAKFYLHKYVSLQLSGPLAGFGPVFGGVLISHLLFDAPPFYEGDSIDLSWEIGAGPGIYYKYYAPYDNHDLTVSLNFDLGFQFIFKGAPVDLVLAYQPSLYWHADFYTSRGTKWHFDHWPYGFAIASRYYF